MANSLHPGGHDWNLFPGLVEIRDPLIAQTTGREAALLLFQMATIRSFEQWLLDNEELAHGPVHSSIGQEAVAVGAIAGLSRSDCITSTHRAHHHVLAKLMDYHIGDEFNPADGGELPGEAAEAVYKTMSEILGLRDGWAGGRGGSMHLASSEAGVLATSAIVGGGIPIAAGAALAAKFREEETVGLAFFGDGASSIGSFHEGISMARACGLPAIFLVDNNLYSVATTVLETVGFEDIVIRAAGQDMPGLIVDGMNPVAVRDAVRVARDYAIESCSPVLIEAKTYRFFHQAGGLPGSAFRYRTADEEAEWTARDPVEIFPVTCMDGGLLNADEVEKILDLSVRLVTEVADRCTEQVSGVCRIRESVLPDPGNEFKNILSDGHEFEGVRFVDPEDLLLDREVTFSEAISRVIHRAMEREPEVFVLGEEVGHLRGGAYGSTRHALRSYPDRVLSTPIAENGFSGVALGAAMGGMKPIVEIMFPDFALDAAVQLFNHFPKARYLYGGFVRAPLVVRIRTAQGRGYGPQHSSDPAALFGLFPGWRIIAPSSPFDYIGLFNTAMQSEDPVLFIEHHKLWDTKGLIPVDDLDFMIPFSTAKVVKEGSQVTVATWSHPLLRVMGVVEQLEREGISVEVIDLRCLDRASLDINCLVESVSKTGAIGVGEDATLSHSIGSQIADCLYQEIFGLLRHPIARITGKDVHIPVSRYLEEEVLLDDSEIKRQLQDLAQ